MAINRPIIYSDLAYLLQLIQPQSVTVSETWKFLHNNLSDVQTSVADLLVECPSVRITTTLDTLLRSPAAEVSIDVRTWASAAAVWVIPPV